MSVYGSLVSTAYIQIFLGSQQCTGNVKDLNLSLEVEYYGQAQAWWTRPDSMQELYDKLCYYTGTG